MAAEILEENSEATGQTDDLPKAESLTTEQLIDEFTPPDTTQQEPPPEPPVDDDIPEKYQGKSIKEVIGMHQEAEKKIGSQGSEVGELRKIVDQYIQAQVAPASQPAPPAPPEETDFFEDPDKAVKQLIETHPELVAAKQAAREMRQQTSLTKLQAKHPDMETVLTNPSFAEWVKGSAIRTELFIRADQEYDYEAADELLSNFKERTKTVQNTVQTETAARQQAAKAAATGGGSGANNSGAKRVYRRADIIKLMKTDPDRYEALSPEIMLAYQEGRVK